MFGFLANLAQRRADLADLGRQAQATEALLSALERDLMTAIAGDAGAGAGIVGRRNNVRILSRSVVLDLSNPSLGDLQQATYRFRPEAGAVECRKRDLYAESPPSTEETLGLASSEPARARPRLSEPEQILTGVEKLEFRYYVRGNWRYSFNSGSAGRLPAAIEISIWYERPESDDDEPALEEELPPDAEQLAYERELFGEEAESSRLSFDLADLADDELPPDRRRVIVIPQIGLVETASATEDADPEAAAPTGRPVEGSTEGGR